MSVNVFLFEIVTFILSENSALTRDTLYINFTRMGNWQEFPLFTLLYDNSLFSEEKEGIVVKW